MAFIPHAHGACYYDTIIVLTRTEPAAARDQCLAAGIRDTINHTKFWVDKATGEERPCHFPFRLRLHQVTPEQIPRLRKILAELWDAQECKLSQLHRTLDIAAASPEMARRLKREIDARRVRSRVRRKTELGGYDETTYDNKNRNPRGRNFATYVKDESPITGRPCCHLEERLGSKALRNRRINHPSDVTPNLRGVWRELFSASMRECDRRRLGRQILRHGKFKHPVPANGYDRELAAANLAIRFAMYRFEPERRIDRGMTVRVAELVRMLPLIPAFAHVRPERVLRPVAIPTTPLSLCAR